MNVLALDIGDKRTGIAFCDSNTKIPSPVKVISTEYILNKNPEFMNILNDYLPQLFVIGLPKSLDGEKNKQAEHIIEVSKKISKLYNIDYEFIDERLSSKEAKKILHEQGLSEKEMKGKIDAVAAALFLETWCNK